MIGLSRLTRVLVLGTLGSLLSPHPAAAQQPNDPQPAAPSIQLNVNKVLIPVVVRDKQGRSVAGLKKEDFQLFDNDKPRPISAFTVEKRGAPESPAVGNTESAPPASSAVAPPPSPSRRFILFLFDDMHISPQDLPMTQKAGEKAIGSALHDPDLVAVVSLSGKTNSNFTRDSARLQDAVKSLQSRSLYRADGMECPSIDYYEADLIVNKRDAMASQDALRKVFNCDPSLDPKYSLSIAQNLADSAARRSLALGHQDVQATYAAISQIVRSMATLPGERSLILVSSGFLDIESDALTAESRLIDLAAQSNVTIGALDARGLYTTEITASQRSPALAGPSFLQNSDYQNSAARLAENPMSELADATGGAFLHNRNDLDAGLKTLTETPEVVYVLELSLDGVKPDGSLHRLKVKVDRPGLDVQARRSYFMPKPQNRK